MIFRYIIISFVSIFCSCSHNQGDKIFQLLDNKEIGIDFINAISESDSVNMIQFSNIFNGSGIGIGDFNLDGKPDLFLAGNMVSGRLFINQSEKDEIRFKDVTQESGIKTDRWLSGVSVADVNADGLSDIYICVTGNKDPQRRRNYLFIHQGIDENGMPKFVESARAYGIDDSTYSTQAAFFDYDKDGDPDLFIAVNYPENFYGSGMNLMKPRVKKYSEKTSRLYKNTGPDSLGIPRFIDVSAEAGILDEGYSLGIAIQDIDDNGWPDVYLSNDFLSNDIVYMNNGDGTFTNKIDRFFKHTTFAGMGCDIADFNNDSRVDIAVMDMIPESNERQKRMLHSTSYDIFHMRERMGYYPQFNRNTLQMNNGPKPNGDMSFSEIGRLANVHYTDWSWAPLFADFNNNGFKDLFITNGFRRDMQDLDVVGEMFSNFNPNDKKSMEELNQKIMLAPPVYVKNKLFENNGDLTFTDRSEVWGISKPSFSNSGAFADFDNDGDLDIIAANIDEAPDIYINNTIKKDQPNPNANYIKISFDASIPECDYIGSKVTVSSSLGTQYAQVYPVRGYLATMDKTVHFGLGTDTIVQELTIVFPSNHYLIQRVVSSNQTINIQAIPDEKWHIDNHEKSSSQVLFEVVSESIQPIFEHKETEFNDFQIQPLWLSKYSQMGPGLAVADVNGDSLEDFFVGGALGQMGAVYIQMHNGQFIKSMEIPTGQFEDMGAIFFDADSDGDQDLIVIAGGVEYMNISNKYRHQVFLNDGHGVFVHYHDAMPELTSPGFCVNSSDFEGDGDLDLFISGRIDIRNYPATPGNYLLVNESTPGNVKFIDATDKLAPDLKNIGMVSASLFSDFDDDGLPDLILAGEWTPVIFLRNTGTSFVDVSATTGINGVSGWWNSINGADFDKDGDTDYVLGNLGLNSTIKTSAEQPVTLHAADFDNNGKMDPIVFQYSGKWQVPIHTRDKIIEQLPIMQALFPSNETYAMTRIADFEKALNTQNMVRFSATEFRTSYIENLGGGSFKIWPFENSIQAAPVHGIEILDCDGDGNADIIFTGNSYPQEYTTGPYDAFPGGLVALGNGHGAFSVQDVLSTGMVSESDTRALVKLSGNNGVMLLSSNNNSELKLFKASTSGTKYIYPDENEVMALVHYKDSTVGKIEFYRSAGYISASSKFIVENQKMTFIEFYATGNRKTRQIQLSANP